jgi:hypothetical protein
VTSGSKPQSQAPGRVVVSPRVGADPGVSEVASNARMRLAVEARFVEFLLDSNSNVAVVKKQPIKVEIRSSWKLRASVIRWSSPFLLRGGVKLLSLQEPEIMREGYKVYRVSAVRKLRYGKVMLVEREGVAVDKDGDTLYTWHPTSGRKVVVTGWLVFELQDGREAKLVPDTPTHVLLVWVHYLPAISYTPKIVYSPELKQYVLYEDALSKHRLIVAIVPIGLSFRACFNKINTSKDPCYYFECYEFTVNTRTIVEQRLIGEFEPDKVAEVVGHA